MFRSIPGCLEGILGSVLGLFRDLLLLLVFTEHSLVIFFDLIMTSEDVETLKWRAARVVTSSSYDRRSVEILYELGWDNLETRRTRQLPAIMFNLKNHIAPDHLAQIFNSKISMYSYNLRNSTHTGNLFLLRPCNEAEKKKNSFHCRRAVRWNSLSNTVKGQTSLKSFISHL